ncbi:MAG: hypothetical protein JNL10_21375 [Verrucomicrobiales bacterium]|nr:hypothetical protein [Verrucomicrobiales bacterium]
MNLTADRMRLSSLTRALRIQWDQTRDHWRDDQALDFERTYLMDLEASVENTVGTIEKLDALLTQLRRDCE